MSIFIAIASFCDPVLEFTITHAMSKAKHPENIFFGIMEQNHPDKALKNIPKNARYVLIDPCQSKGACWARSLTMSLYNEEDWFFQIDSHTYFDQNWDETFINHFENIHEKTQSKLVISSYPNAFTIEDGLPVIHSVTKGALRHVVKRDLQFNTNDYALSFEAHPFDTPVPIKGFQLGAGCIFTKGEFVNRFPYDPYLYFIGEEQTMSVRLFTHGWDIYHIPSQPIYHLYNHKDNKQPPRTLHWDSSLETKRVVPWYDLQNRSSKRISELFNYNKSLGIYGLGSARSLGEYFELSGIDYVNKLVKEPAYTGYIKTT